MDLYLSAPRLRFPLTTGFLTEVSLEVACLLLASTADLDGDGLAPLDTVSEAVPVEFLTLLRILKRRSLIAREVGRSRSDAAENVSSR